MRVFRQFLDGVLRSSLHLGMHAAYSAISSRPSTTRRSGGLACLAKVVGKCLYEAETTKGQS